MDHIFFFKCDQIKHVLKMFYSALLKRNNIVLYYSSVAYVKKIQDKKKKKQWKHLVE